MAKKKVAKKKAAKKKAKAKKKPRAARSKVVAKKKRKAKAARKPAAARRKKVAARPKAGRRGLRGSPSEGELVSFQRRGLGARTGGQSGDTQGIRAGVNVDSESVEELLEEGQSYEAEIVNGVENAPDPDQGEVRTHEVPEDDVPEEYRDED